MIRRLHKHLFTKCCELFPGLLFRGLGTRGHHLPHGSPHGTTVGGGGEQETVKAAGGNVPSREKGGNGAGRSGSGTDCRRETPANQGPRELKPKMKAGTR